MPSGLGLASRSGPASHEPARTPRRSGAAGPSGWPDPPTRSPRSIPCRAASCSSTTSSRRGARWPRARRLSAWPGRARSGPSRSPGRRAGRSQGAPPPCTECRVCPRQADVGDTRRVLVPVPTGCAMAHCQPTMADRVGMEAPAIFQSSWVDASAASSSQGLGCASDGSIAVCTHGGPQRRARAPYLKAYDGAGKLLWDSGAALNSWAWTSGQLRGPVSAYDPASGRHLATLDLHETLMDSPVASTPPTPRAGGATGSTSRPSSSWTTAARTPTTMRAGTVFDGDRESPSSAAAPRFFALRDRGSRPNLVWQYGRRPGGGLGRAGSARRRLVLRVRQPHAEACLRLVWSGDSDD